MKHEAFIEGILGLRPDGWCDHSERTKYCGSCSYKRVWDNAADRLLTAPESSGDVLGPIDEWANSIGFDGHNDDLERFEQAQSESALKLAAERKAVAEIRAELEDLCGKAVTRHYHKDGSLMGVTFELDSDEIERWLQAILASDKWPSGETTND